MSIIFMYSCLGMREWYVYHIHVLLSGNEGVVCLSYSCIVWE